MPNGILYEQTKILLAERFINVQFLVPFPKYNLTILDDYTILSKKLNSYWTQPSLFRYSDFSTGFNSNDSFFNVDWLLNQVKQEPNKAKLEVEQLHAETKEFPNPDHKTGNAEEHQLQHLQLLPLACLEAEFLLEIQNVAYSEFPDPVRKKLKKTQKQ